MKRLLAFALFIALTLCAHGANLIPNSSFEAGTGRGWMTFGTSNSAFWGEAAGIEGFRTNDSSAAHGGHSMILLTAARLQSRAIWLTAGSYRLTFSARTFSGTQGAYYWGVMAGNELSETTPANSGNFTATWSRVTNSFTASSNAFYWVKLYNVTQPAILVDAVQLESGTAATAYAPAATIECGLSIPNTNNMWFAGDTPRFTLNFWNDGVQTNARVLFKVFDVWNSNCLSGDVSVMLSASAASSRIVDLPTRKGWLRVTSRLAAVNDSQDELATVIYPSASNVVKHATNDWIGGHPHASAFAVEREARAGRRWARVLSPNSRNTRWADYPPNEALAVEPTRGAFNFDDQFLTNYYANRLNVVGNLTAADGLWPAWATNTAATTNATFPYIGSADLPAYSNYCYVVVSRFKDWVKYWEVWNEPYQSGPASTMAGGTAQYTNDSLSGLSYTGTNLPINIRVATNYAKVLAWGIAGITNADPTAKIIGMAGAFGSGEWAWEVWTNLPPGYTNWISIISTHIYAQFDDANNADPGNFSLASGWVSIFGGIRPIWNTESGVYYGFGSSMKGINGLFPSHFGAAASYYGSYDVQTDFGVSEAVRNTQHAGQLSQTMRNICEVLRAVGIGFSKFFYYDTRQFGDAGYYQVVPYAADYLNVDRPEVVAVSVASHFVQPPGLGRITNAVGSYVQLEMFMMTNAAGLPVAVAWNQDRTNRTLTVSNSFFAVYDCMGNLVQTNLATVKITRMPQYITSGTLSVTQLSNTLAFASGAGVADTLPPQVSVDIVPSGLWSGDTNRQFFKWTAIDDTWTAWPTNGINAPTATNVVYKWKLDSGTYTSYSQSNHVWFSHLAPGNHTLYVTAADKSGNAAEVAYEFLPPTSVLNVSGTARIGVVTILSP